MSFSSSYRCFIFASYISRTRSEEHTSELQSRLHLVCRLLLEKKKEINNPLLSKAYVISRSAALRCETTGDVFSISLLQDHTYPMRKPPSTIDYYLSDGTCAR